jgi:hypothetical protein
MGGDPRLIQKNQNEKNQQDSPKQSPEFFHSKLTPARHSRDNGNPDNDRISSEAGQNSLLARYWKYFFTGFRPDETTSHSTKLANNASKVAGYSPE